MLCTSSMPSGTVTILRLLSGPGYAISSSGFLSSDVPDSELQASVSHTLDVENWWLDSRHCCVHLQAVEGHGLSGVIKTRHHDLQLSDTTVASHCNSAVVSALKRFWCSRRKVTVFNDPFCSQISSGTLIADWANKILLGTPQQLGRASSHSSDETFAHV